MIKNFSSTSNKYITTCSSSRNLSPQVKIYNRHFYLRQAIHDQIQNQYQTEIKKLSNTPKITSSSYTLLAQRLQKLIFQFFKRNIHNFFQSEDQNQSISFIQMQKVIKQFIQFPKQNSIQQQILHCQLWLLMSGYQIDRPITIKIFYSIIRIMLDPHNLSVSQMKELIQKIPSLNCIDKKRQRFLKNNKQLEDQTFSINKVLSLWNKSRVNNCISKGFKKSTQIPILSQRKHITYQPSINKNSRILAQKSLFKYLEQNKAKYNLDIFQQNNLSKSRQKQKSKNKNQHNESPNVLNKYLKQSRQYLPYQSQNFNTQNQRSSLSYHDILYKRNLQKTNIPKYSCQYSKIYQRSLTPKTSRVATKQEINKIVDNLYFVRNKQKSIDYKATEQQKQLKKCTFRPKINRSSSAKSTSPNIGVRGFNQTINRLKKGRQQQSKKKHILQNMGRVKKPQSLKTSRAPSFIQRDTPKLILQVKIDHERIQKIHLKGDEDPHIVAKKFVSKHNLSPQMQSVLQELVDQQLSCL